MIDLQIKHKKDCMGCYACTNVCPVDCITMIKDNEGFSYPKVDYDICIKCVKCVNTCPIINSVIVNNKPEAFACINKDEIIRLESSSGGIFTLLAEKVIENNGVVFGAGFDDNFNLRHCYIEDKSEIYKFRGSKYLQSEIGRLYKKVKEFLDNGREVLFSGIPCQIAGLKSYLNKEYVNLICVDLVCHGVPSLYVWNKYKQYRERGANSKIKHVNFRQKDFGWLRYSIQILFENENKYQRKSNEDYYMQAFIKGCSIRPSCFDCRFKGINRNTDITLADFWGIQDIIPQMNDDKGISLIFINSKKGKNLLKNIENKIEIRQVDINQAVKCNPSAVKSARYNPRRDRFFRDLNKLSFDKLAKKYCIDAFWDRVKRKIKYLLK